MKIVHTKFRIAIFTFLIAALVSLCCGSIAAQTGKFTLGGSVLDPSGAVLPGANVVLTQGQTRMTTVSDASGRYELHNLSAGTYQITVDTPGFAQLVREVTLTASEQLDLPMAIEVEQQQVTVSTDAKGLSLSSSENANSVVLKGSDLDALSDDPDELQAELDALAGPTAGPDGSQMYVDGFAGGQLPPKSSILEIHINQNPFSSEFDRMGYGRIEIITKPGVPKFSGRVGFGYLNSALDTSNPLVTVQPSYQYYSTRENVTGPITRAMSYFEAASYWERQNQNIISAVNPANTAATINLASPAPYSTTGVFPRWDAQFGKNILSVSDVAFRTHRSSTGIGGLVLQPQAYDSNMFYSGLQVRDTVIINPHFLNETSVQWSRIRTNQNPAYATPAVTVQGSFTTGGSSLGEVRDHEDIVELHNYATLNWGKHYVRTGVMLRSSRDANLTTAGANGSYDFQSIAQYLAGTPYLYSVTAYRNPLARVLGFDGALFYQDEWRWKPNLNLSLGMRVEGQSRIHDPLSWAPRAGLTWAPGKISKTPPKTEFHAAGGLFYTRFALASEVQTVHNNGVNQQNYVVQNPATFNETTATVPTAGASIPTIDTLDPHFHASQAIQGALGVDRTVGKGLTLNLNYLYTRGVHQYLTNNISSPIFNPATYTVSSGTPANYNYQFQSGGLFKEQQLILTATAKYKKLSMHSTYTFSHADSDTQGAGSIPMDAQDPALDYGRATFGIENQLQMIGNYAAPFGISISPMVIAQSGTPYNITTGSDLTGNNQANARPTYGTCGASGVVTTSLGCLDTNPVGKGEKIIPYNVGTGPVNAQVNISMTKTIGIGPRINLPAKPAAAGQANAGAGNAKTAANAAPVKNAPLPPHRYSIMLLGGATNIFNEVNLAPPNGVLSSPLFGKSQTQAGGYFYLSSPGNRTVYGEVDFVF